MVLLLRVELRVADCGRWDACGGSEGKRAQKAVRAAGSANGANNVAVLIPCHRVVRSDGSLGGYAYGAPIKEELLRREKDSAG